ncbi:MAG: aminopeptidase P family protein [Nitrospiraceae bacterium]|nr:MAG: aminopeptidase P family protein [Nitrospiraceae bacterium]
MQRKALLRRKLLKLKVDAILITDLLNVKYLTGFTGSAGYALVTPKEAVFVTDFRYQEQSRQEVKGFKIRIERGERAGEIKDLLEELGVKKPGFEDHHVTYGFYKKLLMKKIRLKPLTGTVESLRIVKSPVELDYISKAVKRAERAFRRLRPFIKAGTTERKLALKLEELLKEEGCKTLPFEVIVASGFQAALPHARPTSRVIKEGDPIVFDWGGEYEGYYSDMTRTVIIKGKDISRQREIYNIVLDAQKKAIGSVKANISATEVDAAARNYIKQAGHGENFGHGTGHGVGLAVHEKPYISWRSKDVIRENMVFTIEPGIYLPGLGGVRIEDMVVVKKDGAEVLTGLPKSFKII